MTLTPLLPHPDCPAPGGLAVRAGAAFARDGALRLSYRLSPAGALRIPHTVRPGMADGLWRHTCCEAFVAPFGATEYREFNLSPCGRWAAYRFSSYRERDAVWQPPAVPAIVVSRDGEALELAATLPAPLLPERGALDLALTVVAEDHSGTLSYWALAHAGERPDFHLRASFSLRLERP